MKAILIGIGVAALGTCLGLYWWEQYNLIAQFQFDFAGLKILNITANSISTNIVFKIVSKTQVEFSVSNINVDIYINGTLIANANQPSPQNIPADGFNYINVNMIIQAEDFVTQILSIITGDPSTPLSVRTVGTCSIKSGFISIDVPFDQTYNTTEGDLIKQTVS